MDTIDLAADKREVLGKKVRFLRRQGLVPANLYGRAKDSLALQMQIKDFQQALVTGGRNAVMEVKVNGEKNARTAIVRGLQLDPRTDQLLHVDFYEVDVTQSISAEVPIELVGESPAARGSDAMISQSLTSLSVEGLPTDLPRSIEVDISFLSEIDQEVRVKGLSVPSNISVLTHEDQLVVKVSRGRIAAEEEAVVDEELEGVAVDEEGEVAAPEAAAEDSSQDE
jgi:large subunit ribosomal protein L25